MKPKKIPHGVDYQFVEAGRVRYGRTVVDGVDQLDAEARFVRLYPRSKLIPAASRGNPGQAKTSAPRHYITRYMKPEIG